MKSNSSMPTRAGITRLLPSCKATLYSVQVSYWQKEITMPIETYTKNPALRPTVLARDVLENVYRPSGPARVQNDSTDSKESVARETNRAA